MRPRCWRVAHPVFLRVLPPLRVPHSSVFFAEGWEARTSAVSFHEAEMRGQLIASAECCPLRFDRDHACFPPFPRSNSKSRSFASLRRMGHPHSWEIMQKARVCHPSGLETHRTADQEIGGTRAIWRSAVLGLNTLENGQKCAVIARRPARLQTVPRRRSTGSCQPH